jgi:C-5 cytosine-specific DNA methylase
VKILELFSGTESFSKVARERGHQTCTIDNNPFHKPDWCVDILNVKPIDILDKFGRPDVIWASPPCQHFSIATNKHWHKRRPKAQTIDSVKIVSHTLKLIIDLLPKFWFLENPRGRLRFILGKPFVTVFYGAYDHPILKPTDFWGYHPRMTWRKKPWWSFIRFDQWERGKDRAIRRSIVPRFLCSDIIKACERGMLKYV